MAGIKKQQGIVERVNVTELPEPEEFIHEGKTIVSTHRYGIKLEGIETWFNLGSGDKADLVFKDDGKWQILGKGSEVLIKYVENTGKNGKTYFNTKKSQVTVIEMVPGEKQQPKVQGAAASSGSGETKQGNSGGGNDSAYWARKDAGSAASASVDKALAYFQTGAESLAFGDHEARMNRVLQVSRDMQAIVQQLANEILSPPQRAPSPAPSPEKPAPKKTTAKPAPPVEEDEWQDDDLPFN